MRLVHTTRRKKRQTSDTTVEPVYTTQSPDVPSSDITHILDEIDECLEQNEEK